MLSKHYLITVICLFVILQCSSSLAIDAEPIGWATLNGGTTGGAGGDTVTVTTKDELRNALNSSDPKIIRISGIVGGGFEINGKSDKTIEGIGSNSGWDGFIKFRDCHNFIIRNCNIGNSGDDGITIQYSSTNFWVDHCTFVDCGDGELDIVHGSDYITVSWCKFYYTDPTNDHRLVNLIGGSNDNGDEDAGHLNVTFHHNWWADLCDGRMPRVRFGKVHVFNNYYAIPNHGGYCIAANWDSQLLVENNYFYKVDSPYNTGDAGAGHPGKLKAVGNILEDCYGSISPGTDTVFTPPYAYTLEDPATAMAKIIAGAGTGVPSTMSPYGDFTGNHIVDLNDMPDFLSYWLVEDCFQTEWVDLNDDCLVNFYEFSVLAENWREIPPDTVPPWIPTGLWAIAGDTTVSLNWDDNSEPDLDGYNVFRSTTSGGGYTKLNSSLLIDSNYIDDTVSNDTMYYYVVASVDTSENESGDSVEACAVPGIYGNNVIIQENVFGFCEVFGTIDNDYAGYTGYGYANTSDDTDRGIRWSIYVASTGTYTFTWRYASGSGYHYGHLYINGSLEVSWINFPGTGAWDSWSEVSVSIPLTIGTQDIYLESGLSDGLANIDYLMVTGPEPQIASCP